MKETGKVKISYQWATYPKYKETGIEWLGEAPEHWSIKKLKNVAKVSFNSVDKHTFENEKPILLCNYLDVYKNEFITDQIEFMSASATDGEIIKSSIKYGDVLITKDSESWNDIAIPSFVETTLNDLICGYHLAHIRSNSRDLDGRYLFRSFQAKENNYQFQTAANGITRYGLSKYSIDSGLFLLPPICEQQAIAAFLDRETAKIDALIEKKQRLIELLQEKRTALISRAVTRGLDPDAPLKDSGAQWLGKIPLHWSVKKEKYVAIVNPSKSEIKGQERNQYVSFLPMELIGIGELSLSEDRILMDVYDGFTYFKDGDVLIAKITPSFENGKGAIARNLTNGIGFGTTELHVLRPRQLSIAEFLYYLSISHIYRTIGAVFMRGTAGQKRVEDYFVTTFPVPLPPIQEQFEIVEFINQSTKIIDTLVMKIQYAIQILFEYRTALISAAVTGKIDVRDKGLRDLY